MELMMVALGTGVIAVAILVMVVLREANRAAHVARLRALTNRLRALRSRGGKGEIVSIDKHVA